MLPLERPNMNKDIYIDIFLFTEIREAISALSHKTENLDLFEDKFQQINWKYLVI